MTERNWKGAAAQVWKGPVGCILYMAAWGLASFPLGRMFKRMALNWDRPPFAELPWEQSGKVYEKLGIRRWKDLAPDVSRMFPGSIPKKQFEARPDSAYMRDMLSETCVAELTHLLLCLTGLALIPLWPGPWGILLYIIYAMLGNVPFIMIQRYNRPRFRRMLTATEAWERRQMNARTDTVKR